MAITVGDRRGRRRAETVREILDAAERRLAEAGPRGLSLRAVARDLGMTVQALYHYFTGRDDLVTALVAAAHDDLADAVEQARDGLGGVAPGDRVLGAARAYRAWAVANPSRFGLAYGMPLADYVAPENGDTAVGPARMGRVFAEAVFADWTPQQLHALVLPAGPPAAAPPASHHPVTAGLPPAAAALLVTAWGRMHGMVVLEVFGHLTWTGTDPAQQFDTAMRLLVQDLHRLRTDG